MEHLHKLVRLLALVLAVFGFTAQVFAGAGDLYVTSIDEDTPNNGEIVRISPDGKKHSFARPVPDPYGVVFDSTRQLLVTSDQGSIIYKYAPDATRTAFPTGVNGPIGMAYENGGNLFTAA